MALNMNARINLITSGFTRGMNNVRTQANRLSSHLARVSQNGSAQQLIDSYTNLNERLRGVGLSLRDIARITSGILISQTFYGITRAIREATSALWEFNEGLDYAQVTYSSLFASTDLANDFLQTLQQFSVDTIFEFSELENMSRKLLAYGIEYKNLMYIIEGLTNIGTISGDAEALDRLALAIGQINAKGTLKAEEIRQLTNAYAPMYDILREKFGLSEEQFANIGELRLPAAEVINAIVDYSKERFGSVADSAMYTITGLNNRIVDSMKVMGSEIIRPLSTFYKSFALFMSEQLSTIHDIYKSSGLGGVFEYLVPDEAWQHRIRQFIANIKNMVSQIVAHFISSWPYIKQFFGGFMDALNLFISVINAVSSATLGFFKSVSNNTPLLDILTKALIGASAAWLLFRIQAIGASVVAGLQIIIVRVAQAVVFLANALTAHPIISIILLIGAALVGLSNNANSANSAIGNLIKNLNSYSIGGKTADDVLQVGDSIKDADVESDKFWNSMEEGANDASDAIDDVNKATNKATKGLLSFDEVFKLNEDSGKANGGTTDLSGIEDLASTLSGLGGALIPEIPDLSSYASDFVNTLYTELWEAMKTIASGAATGTVIGALVGFAIGGLATRSMQGAIAGAGIGAKIGAVAGAALAGFWTDVYKEMEDSLMRIAGSAAVGTLAGGLVGMVIGAFATRTIDGALAGGRYGATIGSLLGAGIGAFWADAKDEISNAIEGIIVGGAEGALAGGLAGLVLGAYVTRTLSGALAGARKGALIGSLLGSGMGAFWGTASEEMRRKISSIAQGAAEGALAGGLAGLVLGAFATRTLSGALAGARIGATIGAVTGGAIGTFFDQTETTLGEKLSNLFSAVSAASYGALFGGLVGLIIGAIIGVFAGGVGAIPGAKAGATLGAWIGSLGGMLYDYLVNSGIAESIGEWFDSLWTNVGDWFSDLKTNIEAWCTEFVRDVGLWFLDLKADVKTWWDNLWSGWDSGWSLVTDWFSSLWADTKAWFEQFIKDVAYWWDSTWSGWKSAWSLVTGWFSTLWADTKAWFEQFIKDVAYWWDNTWSGWKSAWSLVTGWFSTLWADTKAWFAQFIKDVAYWWDNTWSGWDSAWSMIYEWFSNLWDDAKEWFSYYGTEIKTWWKDSFNTTTWKKGWDQVKEWFSALWTDISDWFAGLGTSVRQWWDGLWSDKKATVDIDGTTKTIQPKNYTYGHATGGIFNREHIARFAEGNKAEAIIPLENYSAMRPFVDAVSDGIIQGLGPTLASGSSQSNMPPMYVGTLIADERGLQQLYKKFELYEAKELARKGLA